MKKFTRIFAIMLLIILFIMSLSACGEIQNTKKQYTQDDLQGYWCDSGIVLEFNGNNYVMQGDSMGEIETGTFRVEDDTLITSIKTSNISKEEIGVDYTYKIEIENHTLYLDENGSISQYERITAEEVKEIIKPLPSSLLFLENMGVTRNSNGTYSFVGYVTDYNISTDMTIYITSATTGSTFSTGDSNVYYATYMGRHGWGNLMDIYNDPSNITNVPLEFIYSESGSFLGVKQ